MNGHWGSVHSKGNSTIKMFIHQRMDNWIIFLIRHYTAEKISGSELHVSTWINLNTKFGEKKVSLQFVFRIKKTSKQSCMLSININICRSMTEKVIKEIIYDNFRSVVTFTERGWVPSNYAIRTGYKEDLIYQ